MMSNAVGHSAPQSPPKPGLLVKHQQAIYTELLKSKHRLCTSNLSDYQARHYSSSQEVKAKEFLLRRFESIEAQNRFLKMAYADAAT